MRMTAWMSPSSLRMIASDCRNGVAPSKKRELIVGDGFVQVSAQVVHMADIVPGDLLIACGAERAIRFIVATQLPQGCAEIVRERRIGRVECERFAERGFRRVQIADPWMGESQVVRDAGIFGRQLSRHSRMFEGFWDDVSKGLFFVISGGLAMVAGYVFEQRARRLREEVGP